LEKITNIFQMVMVDLRFGVVCGTISYTTRKFHVEWRRESQ